MAEPITINNVTLTGRAQARDPQIENIGASFDADFSGAASYVFDLRTINQLRLFGIPRTLFIDNGSNPKEATVSVSITQQYFIVPAYAAGYFTISASGGSTITVESDGGATDLVTLTIFNYELPPVVWYSFGTFNLDKPLSVYGAMAEGDNIALATNNEAVYIGGKSPSGTFEPVAVDATGKLDVVATIDDSTPIDVAVTNTVEVVDGALPTSTITNTAASTSSVTVVAANANRRGLLLHNNSSSGVNVAFADVDAAVTHSIGIAANTSFMLEFNYTGKVNAAWTTATGNMFVTEFE